MQFHTENVTEIENKLQRYSKKKSEIEHVDIYLSLTFLDIYKKIIHRIVTLQSC